MLLCLREEYSDKYVCEISIKMVSQVLLYLFWQKQIVTPLSDEGVERLVFDVKKKEEKK